MRLHVIATAMCHAEVVLAEFTVANDGPLLLAVIPGGRVQEDKNLAAFLFAGGSILFFRTNCRNFRRADEDALFFRKNTEEYGRLAALLLEWSHLWELSLNERKCNILHFHFQKVYMCDYYLNNLMLTVVNTHSDLGVVFSDIFSGDHTTILGLLRRVFSTISCAQSKCITLVKPHKLYCSSLWHPHLLSDIKCLETVQRRASKFIIHDHSLDYKECLINLNLLPLMMEYEIRDIFFYQVVKNEVCKLRRT